MRKNLKCSITKQPRRHDTEAWDAWNKAALQKLEEAR